MGVAAEHAGLADHCAPLQMARLPCVDQKDTRLEVANGATLLLDSRMVAFRRTLEGGVEGFIQEVRPPDAETLHLDGTRSGTSQNSHTPVRGVPYHQQ